MTDSRSGASDARHVGPMPSARPSTRETTPRIGAGDDESLTEQTNEVASDSPADNEAMQPENPHGARRSLLHTIAALLGSQLATWVIGFALTILIPRYLGPDGVGSLGVATALWSVAAIVITFGTGTLLTLELARDPAVGATFVRPIVSSRVLLFVPAVPIVIGFAILTGQGRTTILVALVLSLTILVRNVAEVGRAGLFGLHHASTTARLDVVTTVAQVLTVLPVLLLGGGVVSLAAVKIVPAMLGAWLLWRPLRRLLADRVGAPQTVRTTLRRGSPFLGGEVAAMAYHNVDVIVLAMLVSVVEVGWYSVLDTLVASFYFIPTILISAVFPRLAEVHALDPTRYEGLFTRALRVLVLAGVPIGLGLIVVADPLVVLLFGDEFSEAGAPLQVYGVVVILGFVNVLLGLHAVVINRQNTRTIIIAAAALATIVLDLILVPWTSDRFGNGAIGGVLSYVVTEFAILILSTLLLARFMLSAANGIHAAKCAVAGGLMMTACWPLREAFLLVPVTVGVIVYVGSIIVMRVLTADERDVIGSVLHKVTSRLPGGPR